MVRYPFDVLRAVSQVEPLTMDGNSRTYILFKAFILRYRRVNATCQMLSTGVLLSSSLVSEQTP